MAKHPGILVLFAALAAFGCMRQPPPASPAPGRTMGSVGLKPGDAVKVEIWREPDLTGVFTVDENGIVVFPLLGEWQVTAVPADSLEQRLATEYRRYLENPAVDVTVLRRIAILGEVRQPGLYPVDATFTLTEALAVAGGVSPTGNKNDIRLIRDGVVVRRSLDAASVIATTPIQSGDQIEVGQRSWFSRNVAVVTTGIAAATSVLVAIIVRR